MLNQQMDMIVLSVHLDQVCLEIGADLGEDHTQPIDGAAIEHAAVTLRHRDQVDGHRENTVVSMSNIVVIAHRPRV